jgi:hypothetical protein
MISCDAVGIILEHTIGLHHTVGGPKPSTKPWSSGSRSDIGTKVNIAAEAAPARAVPWRAGLAAAGTSVMFGFVPLAARGLYADGLSTWSLLCWRYLLALAIIFAGIRLARLHLGAALRQGAWRIALVGVTLGVVQTLCYFQSLRRLDTGIAVLLFYTFPVVTLGVERFFFKQQVAPAALLCVIVIFAGAPISIRSATEDAARTLGVELSTIEVATPDQIPGGFETAAAAGAKALIVLPDAMFWNERTQILALAAKHRMPAIYPEREYADEGGLLAYGANVPDQWYRRATYIDKILRGTKPGDLPIQQPVKFDFIINLKTAKALGLTIPPSVLARADEVIE